MPWTSSKLGLGPGRVERREAIAPGATLRTLLGGLATQLPGFVEWVYDPGDDRVQEHCTLLVNGRAFEGAGGLDRGLVDGDEVTVLPGFSGGSSTA